MRMITTYGEIAIPSDFSITITKSSTYYSAEGEQSLPLTIANTPQNRLALNIGRINSLENETTNKIPVRISTGVYIRDGYIVIGSYTRYEIEAAITLAESDIYAIYSDMSITELFAEDIRDDFAEEDAPVTAWVEYLQQVAAEEAEDDFTCFPVLLDKQDDEESYFITNCPDIDSEDTPIMEFIYACRVITSNDSSEQVPEGYGIAPYLYLHKFLDLLFAKMGYTIANNYLAQDFFAKIVLIHNCVDAICPGTLNYSHIVPSCTVGEFLEFLEKRFNCFIFISTDSASVDIKNLDTTLNAGYDTDISSIFTDDITTTITEGTELVLSSDVSLDGAEAAADTYSELVETYPIITPLDESDLSSPNSKYSVYLRKSTGQYIVNQMNTSGNGITKQILGTNYFSYGDDSASSVNETTADDILPPMIIQDLGSDNILLAPYAGDKIHNTTSYEDEDCEGGDQEIILALDAGFAECDDNHIAKYRLATTQKYNNLGEQWADCSLIPHDIFFKCFKYIAARNKQNNFTISGVVKYPLVDFMKLDISSLKYYKGVQLLPQYINYDIKKNIVIDESSYLVCNNNITVDTDVTAQVQLYYWKPQSELQELLESLEVYGTIIEYFYQEEEDEYKYIPPPTEVGVEDYYYYRDVLIRESNSAGVIENERIYSVKHWYLSAAI